MPAGRLDWNGDAYKKSFAGAVRKRLAAACVYLSSDVKSVISQAGTANAPGPRRKGRPSRARRVYNVTHSSPGEPPFKQTGHLRRSIQWELVGDATGRVGTNLKYGLYLEKGTTRDLAARPYLARQLRARQLTLARALAGPMRPGELQA